MRLAFPPNRSARLGNSELGSAAIVVFALIVIVGALAVSNNIVLAHLQRELRLVEHRQLLRSGAIARTNQPIDLRAVRPARVSSDANSKSP